MKVLHVTNCYPYEKDPDYGVFVKRQIDSLAEKTVLQDVVFLNARERGVWAYFGVWKYDLSSYDVIHCHHLFSFLSVFLKAILKRKPIVLSLLNEFENEIKLKLPKKILGGICSFVSRFASVCIYKASLPKTHNKNLVYLPNGVDMEYFSSSDHSAESSVKKLLFVSSKNPNRKQKRLWLFREVVSKINKSYDVQVEGVVASGITPEQYLLLMQESDMHLLCSEYEGSPNSVKEAMSCNVPVVSTDVGNVKQMFGRSTYYRVSDSSSVDDLADLVVSVLSLPKSNIDGRELVLQSQLDLDSVANRLVSIYHNVS